ncbi:MAG: 4-(cytidine 5'-diphospho)-2-C-methyl-D-erythritol kinase [Alphaproteobacteria bacterium]|nr:MAG: 4-(cytidine 5'-diphospho)-2-C-methyl-D-erythritol kinase [Alphaproteobacteria bacterium]
MRFEPFSITAPAKVNLFLHITGRRTDGYHLLSSLIDFADSDSITCDRLDFAPAQEFSLQITGDFAAALRHEDPQQNLIARAAEMLCGSLPPIAVTLVKNLPVAAGIGGGSADAAACLKALSRLFEKDISSMNAATLGADIPACLAETPVFASGIGEKLHPITLPPYALLLVNPGKTLSTPDVFRHYAASAPVFRKDDTLPDSLSLEELIACVTNSSNDLQHAATALMPEIGTVLQMLENQTGCLAARMSGSGATCFGIFADDGAVQTAAQTIKTAQPDWWFAVAKTFS